MGLFSGFLFDVLVIIFFKSFKWIYFFICFFEYVICYGKDYYNNYWEIFLEMELNGISIKLYWLSFYVIIWVKKKVKLVWNGK